MKSMISGQDATIHNIAIAAGLFVCFAFIHFVIDCVAQSSKEAAIKHTHFWIRAKHCTIYTAAFLPMFWFLHFSILEGLAGICLLFGSHMVFDTYVVVFLWAKYIRKPDEMFQPIIVEHWYGQDVEMPNLRDGFKRFVGTPIGLFLAIIIDQLCHLTILWGLVWIAMR